MAGDDANLPEPPPFDVLRRLGTEQWALVLSAARRALHEVDVDRLPPRLVQLRALPTPRLLDGRARDDLCRALASEEVVWAATARRLRDGAGRELLDRLGSGDARPPRDETPLDGGQATPHADGRVAELEETVQRLRDRHGRFVAERDEARRRAEGLEARLAVERGRVAELETELEDASRERDELRAQLAAAAEERQRALDRARRQHAAQVAELEDELRRLRRREQERVASARRDEERRRAVEERARAEIEEHLGRRGPPSAGPAGAGAGRVATPGRPSQLPPGVGPSTTEAVASLVVPGRRVLVDGYNVTRQHKDHLSLEQQRIWLVRTLEALAARTGAQVTVVFDGTDEVVAPQRSGRRTTTVFTQGRSADDEIVAIVRGLPAEEPVLVVTDDRELRDRVAAFGADLASTRAFVGFAT